MVLVPDVENELGYQDTKTKGKRNGTEVRRRESGLSSQTGGASGGGKKKNWIFSQFFFFFFSVETDERATSSVRLVTAGHGIEGSKVRGTFHTTRSRVNLTSYMHKFRVWISGAQAGRMRTATWHSWDHKRQRRRLTSCEFEKITQSQLASTNGECSVILSP